MKTIIILLTALPLLSFAEGNRVGNGGDVIHCPQKTELLDLYESASPSQKFAAEETYQQVLEKVLKNIERLHPSQAKQYQKRVAEFPGESEFKDGIKLHNIRDSKHIFKPKDENCELLQIAIRRNEATSESKRFVIDNELWQKMDDRNKAALVMHEVVYEHLFKLGEKNSIKARLLVAYFFSEKSATASRNEYHSLIKELKLPIYF